MASLERDYQQREYNLMINSTRGPIRIQIPNGPLVNCSDGWDFTNDLHKTSFKTTADIKVNHALIKKEELNMLPASSTKAWKITVFRQEPPKPEDPKRNRNLQ
jgi:hypothetical protein